MEPQRRMPRYDVRNDGIGPYAVFYCDRCEREFRGQPDVQGTIARDVGRDAMGGFLRGIPLFGDAVADNVVGEDPRYTYSLTPQQVDAAWSQIQVNFRTCPTCQLNVCLSCFDMKSGYCNEDSPRRAEIAEAQAEQAAGVVKGIASVFGLGDVVQEATRAAKASMARCPNDGTVAAAGTKFCPECGSPMVQPTANSCPKCGASVGSAKFCPQCGTKIEAAPPAATVCGNCGAQVKGGKFCPECGTKVG